MSGGLLSPSVTLSRGIRPVVHVSASFLVVAGPYFVVQTDHILLTPVPVDGRVGCFHLVAIVNCAAENIVCRFLYGTCVSLSCGCITRGGMFCHTVSVFNLLRSCRKVAAPFYIPISNGEGCDAPHPHRRSL